MRNKYQDTKDKVYSALFKLKYENIPLTRENIHLTLHLKPDNISESRWWAMLTTEQESYNA